ncbi:MAG: metalloregulator ArsR/SmtB family transcription factor [Bryobacteraceae bacterium]
MDDAQFQAIAKTLADPNRMAALEMIATGDNHSCTDIRDRLGLSAATISHHVKELTESGLVTHRKAAKFVILTINRAVWREYLKELQRRIGKI